MAGERVARLVLHADVPASPAAAEDEGLEPMMLLRKLAMIAATSGTTSRWLELELTVGWGWRSGVRRRSNNVVVGPAAAKQTWRGRLWGRGGLCGHDYQIRDPISITNRAPQRPLASLVQTAPSPLASQKLMKPLA